MKRQCEFLFLLAAFAVAFSAVTVTKGIQRGKNKDMSRLTLGERQILSQLNMVLALTECLRILRRELLIERKSIDLCRILPGYILYYSTKGRQKG